MNGLDLNPDYDSEFVDTLYDITSTFGVILFVVGILTEILLLVDLRYALSSKFRDKYSSNKIIQHLVSKETQDVFVSGDSSVEGSMTFKKWLKMHKSFAFITVYLISITILMVPS